MNPKVSIVLGSYNRHAFLKAALESIRNNGISFPYEIIVVDGGSTDGSLHYLLRQKDVITIIQHNHGFFRNRPVERRSWGYFMNLGFRCTQGKYILMMSDDSLLIPGGAQKGVEQFESLLAEGRKVGAMAFYWRDWPGHTNYWVGLTLGGRMFVNHGLFLREAIMDIGLIDEQRYKFYFADGDLCLRLWQSGYEVVDARDSYVEHFVHANMRVRKKNMLDEQKDWQNYLNRWAGIFYNPDEPLLDGSVRKEYEDPSNTVGLFPKVPVWLAMTRRFAVKVKKNVLILLNRMKKLDNKPS
jgi:glycosyltransferase involved in cell wall biosynthesis